MRGIFRPEQVAYFQKVIARLKAEGCDAVALSCTEIPLIINDQNSPLPTLDSTRLLARAALKRATEGVRKAAYVFAGSARLRSRVFIDAPNDRAIGVARSQQDARGPEDTT